MAKFVFGMNLSLDGYVDHQAFAPDAALFRHWIDQVRAPTGSVYGRGVYDVMRYWDEEHPEWTADERDFATAWRSQPKWVISRSLKSVGPNATLVSDDIEAVIRKLKAQLVGEVDVSGPDLAQSLTDLGLVDEYRLYFHPVVLGHGKHVLRRPSAAAPTDSDRRDRRGRDQVDVRHCLTSPSPAVAREPVSRSILFQRYTPRPSDGPLPTTARVRPRRPA